MMKKLLLGLLLATAVRPAAAQSNGEINLNQQVRGELPVAHGGTGSTNAAAARGNLGLNTEYLSEAHAWLGYVQVCQGKAGGPRHANLAVLHGAGDYLVLHNVACIYAKLSGKDPKRARELQDMALDVMRREVELWERDRRGPDPRPRAGQGLQDPHRARGRSPRHRRRRRGHR